ncbi:MAG: AcrB/AcrD/AcrF family protein [Alphaproteobacteria bacterium]|nr:AcrB/AcrD/AcrF family protein [Alphaproteobacteria bacterium]
MEGLDRLEKHWRALLLLFWVLTAALLIYTRWGQIRGFGLGDTDDNMRMMQVRAWLSGQGWYDLRQYRMNPPYGADIHWSRLVDLPIAGLKLLFAPLVGGPTAERIAVAVAPLLPMGVAFAGIAVAIRRLIAPQAFALGIAILLCAHSARGMWTPCRIDHHGWQLALLAVSAAALVDPRRARGGAILAVSSILSFVIGLEMLPYLAVMGAIVVLMWVRDGGEARRLAAYGGALAGGAALGYLLFASYANRAPVCDALSPVWLSVLVAAGAIAFCLAAASPRSLALRLVLAAAGGALLAAGFAHFWPDCLGRPEHASPLLDQLWLSHVREARPIYRHDLQTIIAVCTLPAFGLLGYAAMLWRHRREADRLVVWAAVAAPALLGAGLLLWQSRAGPAAQLLAVPGATALAWILIPLVWNSRYMLVRVLGTVLAFLLASGILVEQAAGLIPQKQNPNLKPVNRANGLCPTLWALRPVAMQPKGQVLTFVDLGPRLITVTPHSAVAGPYHRNGRDIIDVMLAFRGNADNAHAIVERRHIDYVLICPGMSESTIYASEAPGGFYTQLARGKVPAWLAPVALPTASPYKMWRVVKPAG